MRDVEKGRKFEVTLREIVVDDCSGYYVVNCVDLRTGVIVKSTDVFDNLHDALSEFADAQADWYEELGCNSTTDEWHVVVDLTL